MTNFRVRRALADTPAYRPGRPPAAVEGVTSYKLSSNENHLEPLASVVEAVEGASGAPALYPDPAATELTAALADYHGVPVDHVVTSAGSSESLAALVGITLDAEKQVVYPWPSFEMYPQLSSFSGARQVAVPLTADGRHDLPAMAQAITDDTGLVLLCSPNNPTGAVLGQAEFDSFMSQVPQDLIVVLDEAYIEFADGSEAVSALRTSDGHPDAPVDMAQALDTYSNLAVLRTFSKAHGLAGLRDLGFDVPPSGGNFVWLSMGEHDAHAFAEACLARGLAVRDLGRGIRVTVGPQEAMDRLVDVAADYQQERSA